MATHMVHPASQTNPAEFIATRPVPCAACNTQWDEDDDLGTGVDHIDGEYYCIGECLKVAKVKYYRRTVAELVDAYADKLLHSIAHLEKELGVTCDDDPAHPAIIIEDLRERMKLFSAGRDSGWRNGLMLDWQEAAKLRRALENAVDDTHCSIIVRLALTVKCGVKGYEWQGHKDGVLLARLGRTLLNFDDQRARTENGVTIG